MEKQIKIFWVAGYFLPAINATVFSNQNYFLVRQTASKFVCQNVTFIDGGVQPGHFFFAGFAKKVCFMSKLIGVFVCHLLQRAVGFFFEGGGGDENLLSRFWQKCQPYFHQGGRLCPQHCFLTPPPRIPYFRGNYSFLNLTLCTVTFGYRT